MWIVYIHITSSNKKYIGITSKSVDERWRNGNGYYNHKYFYSAIKKYGRNNIKHKILEDNLEKNNTIIELYKNGKTITQIQNITGLSQRNIRKIVNFIFITNNEKQLRNENIRNDYKNGESAEYLMNKYNIKSKSTFNNIVVGIYSEITDKENKRIKQEMCELRNNGWLVEDIAKKYNCHREKVSNLTKECKYDKMDK